MRGKGGMRERMEKLRAEAAANETEREEKRKVREAKAATKPAKKTARTKAKAATAPKGRMKVVWAVCNSRADAPASPTSRRGRMWPVEGARCIGSKATLRFTVDAKQSLGSRDRALSLLMTYEWRSQRFTRFIAHHVPFAATRSFEKQLASPVASTHGTFPSLRQRSQSSLARPSLHAGRTDTPYQGRTSFTSLDYVTKIVVSTRIDRDFLTLDRTLSARGPTVDSTIRIRCVGF